MRCYEGTDCEERSSCSECTGAACARIITFDPDNNGAVALTCIPDAIPQHHDMALSECHLTGTAETCFCDSHDYCNSSEALVQLWLPVLVLLLFLLFR